MLAPLRIAAALGAGMCWLALVVLTAEALAAEPPPRLAGDLAPRLSSGSTATEYWDVTAWLESGHRFFARFLVTNEGPGVETAAAVGHLILPDGEVVPIKYGRRRHAWTLGADRRSLKIASAVLDLGGPTILVEIDSDKRGIKLRLEIARDGPPVATMPLPSEYWVDVVMPAPAHARLWVRGMTTTRSVAGTGALTHTWMERPEGDLVRRRAELLTRTGDVAVYLSDLTLADGRRRSAVLASHAGHVLNRADDAALTFGGMATAPGDPRYPVAARWDARSPALEARVDLSRELLRWDPLDVLPQPFRMLVSLRGHPQRVWAEANVDLAMMPHGGGAVTAARGDGIVVMTFARPTALP